MFVMCHVNDCAIACGSSSSLIQRIILREKGNQNSVKTLYIYIYIRGGKPLIQYTTVQKLRVSKIFFIIIKKCGFGYVKLVKSDSKDIYNVTKDFCLN